MKRLQVAGWRFAFVAGCRLRNVGCGLWDWVVRRGNYGKAQKYFLENISKLSIFELKENSFQAVYEQSPWIRGTNRIQFEYLGKTISFGRKLYDKDTKLFFNLIAKRIDQYQRKK